MDFLKKCKDMVHLGCDTVGTTYCLNKVLRTTPRLQDTKARRSAIASLRTEIAAKGLSVHQCIEERLEDLAKEGSGHVAAA